MSYDQIITAVKSNPALAAELAGASDQAASAKILEAHGIAVPAADVKPSAEQEKELEAIAGGGNTVNFNFSC